MDWKPIPFKPGCCKDPRYPGKRQDDDPCYWGPWKKPVGGA